MPHPKKAKSQGDHLAPSILIKDCKIWTGRTFEEGSILLAQGRIARIAHRISAGPSEIIRAHRILALPGLIDAHVHLRDLELGYKENFETGTAAASAGGFTSVLDMPNTEPPTDSPARLKEKMEIAEPRILVNVGFHVAAVSAPEVVREMASIGAFSLKLYLPRPISPLNAYDDRVLLSLMESTVQSRLPITIHAEDPTRLASSEETEQTTYSELAKARPAAAETEAVSRILRLRGKTGSIVHFCHLTLPSSLGMINRSHSSNLSSEVTPHHLLLSSRVLSRLRWKAWMVPPLRPDPVRRKLLSETVKGRATLVASDHAPHAIKEKMLSPKNSPPGIPGLETTLPLLLTLVNKGRMSVGRVVKLLSTNPAHLFGLSSRGNIAKGGEADIVLVDLKKRSRINADRFFSKAKYSPFEGFPTQGAVHTTIVGGRVVYSQGEIVATPGCGRVLRRRP